MAGSARHLMEQGDQGEVEGGAHWQLIAALENAPVLGQLRPVGGGLPRQEQRQRLAPGWGRGLVVDYPAHPVGDKGAVDYRDGRAAVGAVANGQFTGAVV